LFTGVYLPGNALFMTSWLTLTPGYRDVSASGVATCSSWSAATTAAADGLVA
jgi:hypothetical protein